MTKEQIKDTLRSIGIDFKESSKGLNFRCVICKDSKKSKSKKRGWVLFRDNQFTYYCHNCGASISFKTFLKDYYPDQLSKFASLDNVKTLLSSKEGIVEKVHEKKIDNVDNLYYKVEKKSFNLLDKTITSQVLRGYQAFWLKTVINRKIPKEYYKDFRVYYADDILNGRLIIPYLTNEGIWYAFQARSPNKVDDYKYLTQNEDNIKIWGYFQANTNEYVKVTEGPFNAMFLKNSLATSGTVSFENEIVQLIIKKFPKRIWVFDNDEPGKGRAISFLENGEKVFIWGKIKEKDINDVIVNLDLKIEDIDDIILKNSYKGLIGLTKIKLEGI